MVRGRGKEGTAQGSSEEGTFVWNLRSDSSVG